MKDVLRIAIVITAFPIAYFAAMYAERFTAVPLGNGRYEGTPLTALAFFAVFPVTFIVIIVAGNILITRAFRSKKLE